VPKAGSGESLGCYSASLPMPIAPFRRDHRPGVQPLPKPRPFAAGVASATATSTSRSCHRQWSARSRPCQNIASHALTERGRRLRAGGLAPFAQTFGNQITVSDGISMKATEGD